MSKEGISFFSFDTGFFQDKKVRLIKGEFGAKGVEILLRVLCVIYSDKGYYMNWSEDDCYLMSEGVGCDCTPNLIGEVINRCVKRGIFNEEVFNAFGVITSHGIQIRYINAVARRDEIRIIKEYALFDINELSKGIRNKVTLFSCNVNISNENVNISNENVSILPIKERNKEREIDNIASESADADSMFNMEQAWKDTFEIYPKKSGAVMARVVWMDKLVDVIESNRKDVAILILCATQMYIDDYKEKNPSDNTFQYIPKYENWLKNDCDYWIQKYEESQKAVMDND